MWKLKSLAVSAVLLGVLAFGAVTAHAGAGGIDAKKALLRLEGCLPASDRSSARPPD